MEIVSQAYAQSIKNYQIKQIFTTNKVYFQKGLKKIVSSNRGDFLYCLQYTSDKIDIIDNKCGSYGQFTVKDNIASQLFQGKFINNEVKSTLLSNLLTPKTINQLDFKTEVIDIVYSRLYKNVRQDLNPR